MEDGEDMAGFISAYILPGRPDTLFIWQVAVGEDHRGQGLAKRMVRDILSRPACKDVKFIETTITDDNDASWAMFKGIAKMLDAPHKADVFFDKDRHFQGAHDSEQLLVIGPFENTEQSVPQSDLKIAGAQ